MNKNFLIIALSVLFFKGYTQQLSQVTFSQGSAFAWFSILTDQKVLIRISDDGKILESGTEEQSFYNRNYYAQKLQLYPGVITYYEAISDSVFKGKIKNIGTCFFTYYPSNDYPERVGKIKSAGNLLFDYYRNYNDALSGGKIMNIGTDIITYYASYENEAFKGKLKTVGNTAITYYSTFDDMIIKGKLKSIGSYNYAWYGALDRREYAGALKSGSQRQLINGVTYIIQ